MDLRFNQTEIDGLGYMENGQWTIRKTKVVYELDHYETNGKTVSFPHLKYYILMKRRPFYYITKVVAPCIILSILMTLVFLIPPEAGEKISLGITLLLSFTVFQLIIADSMPVTSDFLPTICKYKTIQHQSSQSKIKYD